MSLKFCKFCLFHENKCSQIFWRIPKTTYICLYFCLSTYIKPCHKYFGENNIHLLIFLFIYLYQALSQIFWRKQPTFAYISVYLLISSLVINILEKTTYICLYFCLSTYIKPCHKYFGENNIHLLIFLFIYFYQALS